MSCLVAQNKQNFECLRKLHVTINFLFYVIVYFRYGNRELYDSNQGPYIHQTKQKMLQLLWKCFYIVNYLLRKPYVM